MANTIPADYVFPPGLPADVCTRLREADSTSIAAVVDAAFAELAFPEHLILLPAERLTPAQRALAQTLAACRIRTRSSCGYGRRYAVPEDEDLAQWLGLEPPDALSETVSFELHGVMQSEPLWRAVLLLQAEDDAAETNHEEAFIHALPLAKRWELWGLCHLRFPRPWGLEDIFFPLDSYAEAHQHLVDGSAHAWAARFLDALVAKQNRSLGRSTLLPFLMLARANAPIEPRWFALLPTAGRFDLVDEIIFSIPMAERGAAVQQWFDRMLFPNHVLKAALRILPRMPEPAILTRAIAAIPEATGSALLHRRALRGTAGTHAELLALIDAADAAAGPPMVLTLLAVRTPTTVAELAEEDQAQLLAAGKRYHGKATSLDALMSPLNDTEASINHGLTALSIGDAKGKPLYDGWLYMTDAGCFFTKGKTRVVAERVQFGIECKNEKLSEALETLLRQPLEPSKAPTKKPAKAKPSKPSAQ